MNEMMYERWVNGWILWVVTQIESDLYDDDDDDENCVASKWDHFYPDSKLIVSNQADMQCKVPFASVNI